jgi:hypothetical protein
LTRNLKEEGMEDTAGWRPDPTGRHEERYFRTPGIPTNRVRNGGIASTDEGPSDRGSASDPISVPVSHATSAPTPSSGIAHNGANLTGTTLVSAYREPTVETTRPQTSAVNEETIVSRPAVVVVPERNWWLITATCVLVVLLAAASLFAVQQHNVANKWMHKYKAEATSYQAELHRSVGLYSSLVVTQKRLSTCGTAANRVLFDLDAYFQRGFLPPSSKSDAATAGQACHTPTQATK